MSRLSTQGANATGRTAELFAAIKSKLGKVPNAYDAIGSNSPVALEALLNFDAALGNTSLSKQEIEVIKLAVSEVAGCDYCLAAHTLMGKMAGLAPEAILAARRGTPTGNGKLDALSTFVRSVVGTTGTVPQPVVDAVKAAGYGDAQVVDTIFAIASITFTNLVNRINDTVVDFPKAPA
ncbi:carboxymuconolactone decarboxylase family protein [uncultured Massilia sp.]|uniref:carboxymuconolactone decarboxylase family protein n=1 Tax=uncultured Massilia sp. TaxID=169973 RepID=UPI0025EE24D3|nr:carboxymuconolactone decarboxylase family protein [uncultured Massilia sp.]